MFVLQLDEIITFQLRTGRKRGYHYRGKEGWMSFFVQQCKLFILYN